MKKAKSILLVSLVLALALMVFQAGALAEENVRVVSDAAGLLEAISDPEVTDIRLDASIDATGSGVVDVSGKTIDLGRNTISADNFTLIFQGADFTLKNGCFDSKGGSYALFIGDEGETDGVLIEDITADGGINVYNATNVVLRNTDITGMDYYAVWCDENGHVTIESGEFKTNGNAVLGMSATQTDLIIKGGNFVTNGKPLVLEGNFGSPVISGGQFDTDVDEKNFAEDAEIIPGPEGGFIVCDHSVTRLENKKEASCTEKGYTGDLYCAACGKKLADGQEIKSLGHDLKEVPAQAPTCAEEGFEAYWICQRCEKLFSDAKGENAISQPAVLPVNNRHDYVNGVCSVCGQKDPNLSEPSDTGDSFLFWPVLALAAGGAGLLAVKLKRARSRR
mgnify:FL=1